MLLLMLSADLIWEEPNNLKKHLSQRRDAPTGMGIPKRKCPMTGTLCLSNK